MISTPRWLAPLALLLVILGGALPVLLYEGWLGRVPTLTAEAAIQRLSGAGDAAVLVDVRQASAFAARHLETAHSWPLLEIVALTASDQVPAQLRDKTLLLVCDVGISSAEAAHRLHDLGLDVHNIRGGLQAWVRAWHVPCTSPLCTFALPGGVTEVPDRSAPRHEQLAQVIAGFVVKPVYMLISLGLAWLLISTRRRAPDLVALRWALIAFFVGESFCVLHSYAYLALHREWYLSEYLHDYGMVLAFGFTTYALIEGLDARVFRLSNPGQRCAALELCGPCIKYEDVPCGARRLFLLLAPLMAVLAAIPLFVPLSRVSYNTTIFGVVYNYAHLAIYQIHEIRYGPILAILLFGLSFVVLWVNRDRPAPVLAKVLFSAGAGLLANSVFRLVLSAIFPQNLVWFEFWEEATELVYMVAIGCVLWIFRRRLFEEEPLPFAAAR